jgi:p-hydroxybenzoate 3-monooxygenase
LKSVGLVPEILQFERMNHRCEFRTPSDRLVVDFGSITGGRGHYIYPQHLMVAALCDALTDVGGDIRFETVVDSVEHDGDGATLAVRSVDGPATRLRFDAAVGADGARSLVAAAISNAEVIDETVPVRLLAVLGNTGPLEGHTLYAPHPSGYASQMPRLPDVTRFYLEVPATDSLDDWPDPRLRSALGERLIVGDRLDGVAFSDASLVDLRMRITTPMQEGNVYLAGDAAHLITPFGGKGMNLAIHDAVELALGLIDRFGPRRDESRLARYSDTRLPEIWRTQAFSRWMLRLVVASADAPNAGQNNPAFNTGLREGWVANMRHDHRLRTWFAFNYAGIDGD